MQAAPLKFSHVLFAAFRLQLNQCKAISPVKQERPSCILSKLIQRTNEWAAAVAVAAASAATAYIQYPLVQKHAYSVVTTPPPPPTQSPRTAYSPLPKASRQNFTAIFGKARVCHRV